MPPLRRTALTWSKTWNGSRRGLTPKTVAEVGRDGAERQDHGEREPDQIEAEEPGEKELAGAERAIAAVLERDVGQGGAGGDQREDRDRRVDRGEPAQAAPAASSAAP